MRRLGLTILAALMLALTSIGVAVADHKGTTDHGPPGDPPCEQGNAGQNNPNCDDDDGGNGPPGNPPCDKGKAGQNNPNCPPPPPPPPPPEAEPCPDGLELDLDPLAYVCLFLLPDDDFDAGDVNCPDGAIPVEVPLEPLVWACVIILPDSGDSAAMNADHKGTPDHGPPGDPPCEQGNAGQNNPNCDDDGNGHGPPGNPPCEQGNAGQNNPNCDGNGTTQPPGAEACPDGLELDLDPLAYVCLFLLPDDDFDAGDVNCPDGAIPVEVPLEPLVWACVIILPDSGESAVGVADSAGAVGLGMLP